MNKKSLLLRKIRKTSHRLQRYSSNMADYQSSNKHIFLGVLAILAIPFLAGYKTGKKLSLSPAAWIPLMASLINTFLIQTIRKR